MPDDILSITRRWFATFNETGMPPLELCDERIEIRNPPDFPVRGTYRGHDGVRKWRDDAFETVDEARIAIDELIDVGDGETVVMFLRFQGTASYSQLPFDEPWAAIWKIRDGKLVEGQGYTSRRRALEAAGLKKNPRT